MSEVKKPELLVPASSLEVLKTAVIFGADAVYIGGEAFGLRAKAKNFSPDDMREGIAFAHQHGVKVYVTANILAHNSDLKGAEEYFTELKEIKPDALIISDPGMFTIAKRVCPEIEIHISTQANNTTMRHFCFGREWVHREWYQQENCPFTKSDRFVTIFLMIWRLKLLFTELCVSPIRADVSLVTTLQAVMRTMVPVHILAVGNMQLWKKNVRANIYRFMKMKEAHTFLTQKICV